MAQQYDVTSVGVNPARDRAYRMRMYFLTMSLRVLCVVSLFWVRGPWIILVGAGAVVLPYVAVLIANAVSHTGGQAPEAPTPRELGAGETAGPGEAGDGSGGPEGSAGSPGSDPAGRRDASNGPTVIVVDAPAERRASGSAPAQDAHDAPDQQPRQNGTPA